jgi:hypothetical protein
MEGFRSILLPVPRAEPLVDPWRRAGDPWRERGVPAHITLAGPWPLEVELPRGELAEAARQLRGTRFELGTAGMLGDALCLFPAEDAALLAWRERALRAVGIPDRLDAGWRLHMTVRRYESGASDGKESARTLARSLPIACVVGELAIAEVDDAGTATLRPLSRSTMPPRRPGTAPRCRGRRGAGRR